MGPVFLLRALKPGRRKEAKQIGHLNWRCRERPDPGSNIPLD